MTGPNHQPFQKPLTAQQAVLEELRRAMLTGELEPGAKIYQESVAERLGLSRVPVREALKILEGEGRVTYTAHYGYSVAALDYDELAEIYRMRELLEGEAVRNGLAKMSEGDFRVMQEAMEAMESEAEIGLGSTTSANRNFHFALFEPSGMMRLVRVIRQLWDSSDPYRAVYIMQSGTLEELNREHRMIYEAAVDRDLDSLLALLDEHRSNAKSALQGVLAPKELP